MEKKKDECVLLLSARGDTFYVRAWLVESRYFFLFFATASCMTGIGFCIVVEIPNNYIIVR